MRVRTSKKASQARTSNDGIHDRISKRAPLRGQPARQRSVVSRKAANAHEPHLLHTYAAIQNIQTGVCVVDRNFRILHLNPFGAGLLHRKVREVHGKSVGSVFSFLDWAGKRLPISKSPFGRVLESGVDQSIDPEHGVRLKIGQNQFYVALRISPIYEKKELTGAVVLFRDVTKRRKIEQAKTEFVSLAAHELRTPLSIMMLNLSLIEGRMNDRTQEYSQDQPREQISQQFSAVKVAARRMTALMNLLLNVARIDTGQLISAATNTDVGEFLRREAEQADLLARERNIHIRVRTPKKLPHIKTDPQLLNIIIQNLLSNAIKYSSPGGKVEVSASGDENTITLSVRDQGIGIPKRQHKKIFTKLFRADNVRTRSAEGTGLGLYIVKSMVEELGGRVWFQSIEGKGTTFFVQMPLRLSK